MVTCFKKYCHNVLWEEVTSHNREKINLLHGKGMRQASLRMAKHLFGSTSHTTFLRAIIEQASLGL